MIKRRFYLALVILLSLSGLYLLNPLKVNLPRINSSRLTFARNDIPPPVTRKVMILWFNPVIESMGGRRINDIFGWNDPHQLETEFINEIKSVSSNYLNYQIVERHDNIDDFPILADGFDYTDETWLACYNDPNQCHDINIKTNYNKILTDYSVCEKLNNNTINELWIWAGNNVGNFWESNMSGPGSFWINGAVVTNTTCNKQLFIMAFNPQPPMRNMLDSYAHRIEFIMTRIFGTWEANEKHAWNRFTLIDKDLPGKAVCGRAHIPPNGLTDYDYYNDNPVDSTCDAWYSYPRLTLQISNINCDTWGCTMLGYLDWWYKHLPKYTGTDSLGRVNNWWFYFTNLPGAIAKEWPNLELGTDLTENNADKWKCVAEEATCTLSNNNARVKQGSRSLKLVTTGLYSTKFYFPKTGSANLDIRNYSYLSFWIQAINPNLDFQGYSPTVYLKNTDNRYFKYEPYFPILNHAIGPWGHWKRFVIPLSGDEIWKRTTFGSPVFADIDQILIDTDTWGGGFTLFIDGFGFID